MNIVTPILFHDFKHHLMSGVEWIRTQQQGNGQMQNQLLTIGSAQLDYYKGGLHVSRIKEEVWQFLSANDLAEKENYKVWLDTNRGYREITLSDNSRWTLRMVEKENYIHIHPSRQSPHTLRIKANTLKTVLCTLALTKEYCRDIELINRYRKEYLNLSPIKIGANHTELENTFNLFLQKLKE
ncbi:MAG: hypothetical protein LUE98_08410 [Tannerellaceae bacterium]|nr:hypothetical protein [Tannerellaceae bacterium]